jgi:FMN phosphatase YigB (HAD superfamily)
LSSTRLALFDLDGTLLAGDTDVLWCAHLIEEGVLDRETFGAANRDVADRYARGAISAEEFAGFYAATLGVARHRRGRHSATGSFAPRSSRGSAARHARSSRSIVLPATGSC